MAKGNKKWLGLGGLLVFIIYTFVPSRPVPQETILRPRWISSLEGQSPALIGDRDLEGTGELMPFSLGERYGYLYENGTFALNNIRQTYVALSDTLWAEYEAQPDRIQVMNSRQDPVLSIEDPRGYPLFLDNRIFIIGSDQNILSSLDSRGQVLWTYDFAAPITSIDAAAGQVLVGTLDGVILLLDEGGQAVFSPFEPGGSRLSVILGLAMSRDASRLAIISGIDSQRFLLMERSGDTYRVIHHEFIGEGFRRPVHLAFTDHDTKILFELQGGLGILDIPSRVSRRLEIEGEILALDATGGNGYLFVLSSPGEDRMVLTSIRYPGYIMNRAPFASSHVFLGRRNGRLYLGGDKAMISFALERR
ncbi:MAG: WD40 repeat domain-containing protein [Treponema sp.]|nr:WD40 repeat domain-containing protein [Treponema sp.]